MKRGSGTYNPCCGHFRGKSCSGGKKIWRGTEGGKVLGTKKRWGVLSSTFIVSGSRERGSTRGSNKVHGYDVMLGGGGEDCLLQNASLWVGGLQRI